MKTMYFDGIDKLFSLWEDAIKDFDHLGSQGSSVFKGMPTFPPADIFINTDSKDLTFKFAVAGIPQENISIDFENDFMIIKIDETKEELKENVKSLYCGIKKSKSSAKFIVPSAKYKQAESKASLKDGILTVSIPASEEQQVRKVHIQTE